MAKTHWYGLQISEELKMFILWAVSKKPEKLDDSLVLETSKGKVKFKPHSVFTIKSMKDTDAMNAVIKEYQTRHPETKDYSVEIH